MRRKAAWTSACTYTSRLAATNDEALSSYGAALDRTTRAVTDTLELDHGDEEPDSLEAAARIFIFAGSEMYRRCRESQIKGIKSTDGLWHGGDGFSEARWLFWKERWAALASKETFSEQGRRTANEALEAMRKVSP